MERRFVKSSKGRGATQGTAFQIVVNKKNQDLPMEASDQFNLGLFYRIIFLGKSRDSRQERRNWCKRKTGKTLTISKDLPG